MYLPQIAGYDVRKRLSTIPSTLPVLILHGTLDRDYFLFQGSFARVVFTLTYRFQTGSVYYTEAKYLTDGIKHAKLQTFEGVGHM